MAAQCVGAHVHSAMTSKGPIRSFHCISHGKLGALPASLQPLECCCWNDTSILPWEGWLPSSNSTCCTVHTFLLRYKWQLPGSIYAWEVRWHLLDIRPSSTWSGFTLSERHSTIFMTTQPATSLEIYNVIESNSSSSNSSMSGPHHHSGSVRTPRSILPRNQASHTTAFAITRHWFRRSISNSSQRHLVLFRDLHWRHSHTDCQF